MSMISFQNLISCLLLELSPLALPSATKGYSWPSLIPGSISISNSFSSGTILLGHFT